MSVLSRVVTVYWVTCDVPRCDSTGPDAEEPRMAVEAARSEDDFAEVVGGHVCERDDELHDLARERGVAAASVEYRRRQEAASC